MQGAVQPITYGPTAKVDPEALVRAHLSLVRKIAWHVHGRVANAIDVEDLVQTGMVALIEAARAYDDRGHAFSTYASMRIRGAMVDSLRRHAAGGRAAMKRRREFDIARSKFEQLHGREPSVPEMAQLVGLSEADYILAADAAQSIRHESIDDLYSDHSMWFADIEDLPEERLSREQLKTGLAGAIDQLPQREALVLQLYFVEELNLDEIGETLGVGAARVCQIKKSALDKLRSMLAELV